MITSILAGCGKNETNQNTSGATAAPTTTQAKEEPKPTLRVLNLGMNGDYNTYPVGKIAEERTGYHVEYEVLPTNIEDKLNILIASGEPYDLITIGGNKALYSDYAKRGALVDLSGLIDKYGPNVKSSVSQESFDSIKVDGKIYAIPNRAAPATSISLYIRQDWLDKLNMKLPSTVDEFTAVLKAFKEKDPGGNGPDKNIPFTMLPNIPVSGVPGIPNLAGAFGMVTGWDDINGKLVPQPLNPGFKDYLNYTADLYKQGLLEKEFLINKDATLKEKFTSGRAGVIPLAYWDVPVVMDALTKSFPNAKASYIPTLKGKDGKGGLPVSMGFDRISFIPRTAKHPEDSMKWINAKLDKDTFKLLAIGEEGKHYTQKDSTYSPILPTFFDERNLSNNYLTGVDEKLYPTYWQCRVKKDQRQYEAFAFMNTVQPPETRRTAVLGLAPYLPEQAKNNATLNTMINDYMLNVIAGGESISGLDAFVQKWQAAGGDKVNKEVNDWYATTKK